MWSTFENLLESCCCVTFADGGCSQWPIDCANNVVLFFFNYFASAKEVQNLSVVTFLPFSKHGSISCSTTLPESPREKGSNSSLPRYDLGFLMYFDSTSAANQNLIPNLLGLFAIYCVKRQRGFVRKNWLLTMIFSPGL